ncbi:MAG: hypothetical protein ACRCTW_12055 [Lactococcus garvieae]
MNKYKVLVNHAGESSCRYEVVMADLFYVERNFVIFCKKDKYDKMINVAAYPIHVVQSVTSADSEA